jgi:hypothetical protein
MSSKRIYSGLAAGLALVLATMCAHRMAYGEDSELQGMACFEPCDEAPYGNWAQPKDGFFLTFDGLWWHISAPPKTSIGDPTLTPTVYDSAGNESVETNGMDTGELRAKWKLGNRIEFGYVEGNNGFLVSTIHMESQTEVLQQNYVPVVFNDPSFGSYGYHYLDIPFPENTNVNPPRAAFLGRCQVIFNTVRAENKTTFDGIEASYLYRPHQLHDGGTLEFLLGGRYLEFDDKFLVTADGGNLADSGWNTYAKNRVAGPQIGVRWAKPWGRFELSSEGRFTAGINSQEITQDGLLASKLQAPNPLYLPTQMTATGFSHEANYTEFSPVVEFRVEAHYQLTELIKVKAGWTGLWMDNIARASDMVDYTVPMMGITTANKGNETSVFVNGVTVGVELNR